MATKKAASKSAGVKKTAPKKTAAKKTADKKTAANKTAAKNATARATAHKTSSNADYTKPELREKIKRDVVAGDKGGRPGQWSARKAQLVAAEYKAEGGNYKHKGKRTETQASLRAWSDEKWHTSDGKQAIQGGTTHRYLPDKAWGELSPGEKKATEAKKVRGSRQGKQFVPNTGKAKQARQHATEGSA